MRAMIKPTIEINAVYEHCCAGVKSPHLVAKFASINEDIAIEGNNYDQHGNAATLYLIAPDNGLDTVHVIGDVTKAELKDLYKYLVSGTKSARHIYNELIASAPGGICPACGLGHASTLDHYLPKAKFPRFTVLPYNLVPACKDCNFEKRTGFATVAGEQTLHPYYDHGNYVADQWMYAEIVQTIPISIRYYVNPPENWSAIARQRVITHFESFGLAIRYSVEAANELAELNPLLRSRTDYTAPVSIRAYLQDKARVSSDLYLNSWKSAMYQALANSDWYCSEGFLN